MTAKIEKLTPAQEKDLVEFRATMWDVGTCTDPADRETAEKTITEMYKIIGKERPQFIWVGSPKAAVDLGAEHSADMSAAMWGSMEAYWVGFYLFGERIGVEYDAEDATKLHLWHDLIRSCGWVYPFENVCVVTERPERICWNDEDPPVIHALDGPAVRYPDGYALWAVEGLVVPQRIVENSESITLDEIRTEENAELKRVLRQQYGEGRYLADIGAKIIHTDTIGVGEHHDGEIMRALMEDDENRRYLVGTDGSTGRTYYMRVPGAPETCAEAHQSIMPPGHDESNIVTSC